MFTLKSALLKLKKLYPSSGTFARYGCSHGTLPPVGINKREFFWEYPFGFVREVPGGFEWGLNGTGFVRGRKPAVCDCWVYVKNVGKEVGEIIMCGFVIEGSLDWFLVLLRSKCLFSSKLLFSQNYISKKLFTVSDIKKCPTMTDF